LVLHPVLDIKPIPLSAFGAISDIEVTNKGKNYYALPGISTIVTELGRNALIRSIKFFNWKN
jgi:hypothetical protein